MNDEISLDALDAVDRAILRELQRDGRVPNVELAARVGLSPTPCLRRVRRLERTGVITGYTAVIDPARLGYTLTAYALVETARAHAASIKRFEAALLTVPGVQEAHRTLGVPDYVVKVLARDLVDYERVYMQHLATLPGAATVRTSLAMKALRSTTALDVDAARP